MRQSKKPLWKLPISVLVISQLDRDHQTPNMNWCSSNKAAAMNCSSSFGVSGLNHLNIKLVTLQYHHTRLAQRPQPFTLKIVPHVARNVKNSHWYRYITHKSNSLGNNSSSTPSFFGVGLDCNPKHPWTSMKIIENLHIFGKCLAIFSRKWALLPWM